MNECRAQSLVPSGQNNNPFLTHAILRLDPVIAIGTHFRGLRRVAVENKAGFVEAFVDHRSHTNKAILSDGNAISKSGVHTKETARADIAVARDYDVRR